MVSWRIGTYLWHGTDGPRMKDQAWHCMAHEILVTVIHLQGFGYSGCCLSHGRVHTSAITWLGHEKYCGKASTRAEGLLWTCPLCASTDAQHTHTYVGVFCQSWNASFVQYLTKSWTYYSWKVMPCWNTCLLLITHLSLVMWTNKT